MKRFCQKRFIFVLFTILILMVSLNPLALAQDEETTYVENDWNYVEGSMDISKGIPGDALGVLESILNTGKLRVATEPYFPPQEFIDPAKSG